MHSEAFAFIADKASQLGGKRRVLEIGSRDINGTPRPCFFDAVRYVGVDIAPGPSVDIVANGAELTPEMVGTFDTVLCCEVFEHTSQAETICRVAYDLLEPGGVFLVTAAGPERKPHSAVDGGGLRDREYYRNVHPDALRKWLSAFKDVKVYIDEIAGDVYASARKVVA